MPHPTQSGHFEGELQIGSWYDDYYICSFTHGTTITL